MALPNWSGNTRYIGPTGPQGPQGANGVSGGQTFYLDSATSTTVPTLGSLLSSPVLTTQTTISHAANSSTVLVATFPTPVGAIPAEYIPPGLWDLNIYAATSAITNAPSFYWSLYQVDSDGVSNPVLISDGSGSPILITNLVASQTLYDSPLFIPGTTLPTGKRASVYLYVVYETGSRTATFEFRSGAVSHIHTTIAESGYNWSTLPAISDVNIAGYNLSNVGTLNSTTISNSGTINSAFIQNSANVTTGALVTTSIVNPSSSNALTIQSPSNDTNLQGNRTFITANQGVAVSATSDIGISASNGSKGRINLTAGPGYSNGVYGEVNLVANGGSVSVGGFDYATGGLITLTATTPVASYYTTTSAIRLSAASILSYAGVASPLASLLGYNFIQGSLGVNICAGSVSTVPNTPGTNYLYGANGTKIQNTLYVDNIVNYPGGNLNIHPDSSNWTDMTRVQYIGMGNNPVIDGGGGSTSYISNFYSITASNMGANTLNISNLSNATSITITAPNVYIAGTLDLCNNALTRCGGINFSTGASANNLNNLNGSNLAISTSGNLTLTASNAIVLSNTGSNVNTISNAYNSFTQSNGTTISSTGVLTASNTSNSLVMNSNTTISSLGVSTVSNASNSLVMNSNTAVTSSGTITISNTPSLIFMPSTGTMTATGGTITEVDGRRFHTFTSSGSFVVSAATAEPVEILVIGGGAGGGVQSGGGGGSGNMIVATGTLGVGTYTVTIGAGGSGGLFYASTGGSGGNSVFDTITALGGGGGGTYNVGGGVTGGSGGGGSELAYRFPGGAAFGSNSGGGFGTYTIISNLAHSGGVGTNDGSQGGAGAGGAGARGTNHVAGTSAGTAGGVGAIYRGTYYAGGGGGAQGGTYFGPPYVGGVGGSGGGGDGGYFGDGTAPDGVPGQPGSPNTGSGGGGSSAYGTDTTGGSGGSGIVIVSYAITTFNIQSTVNPLIITAPDTTVTSNINLPYVNTFSGAYGLFPYSVIMQNTASNTGTGFAYVKFVISNLPAGHYHAVVYSGSNYLPNTFGSANRSFLAPFTYSGIAGREPFMNYSDFDTGSGTDSWAICAGLDASSNACIQVRNQTSGGGDTYTMKIYYVSGQLPASYNGTPYASSSAIQSTPWF